VRKFEDAQMAATAYEASRDDPLPCHDLSRQVRPEIAAMLQRSVTKRERDGEGTNPYGWIESQHIQPGNPQYRPAGGQSTASKVLSMA